MRPSPGGLTKDVPSPVMVSLAGCLEAALISQFDQALGFILG
ncbi:MAG: hypothetical protein AB9869_01995 [Verrucomicrobiia bacterium]